MSARIWAWTGLLVVGITTGFISDLVLRLNYTQEQLKAADVQPFAWDVGVTIIVAIALFGLIIEAARAYHTDDDLATTHVATAAVPLKKDAS